MNRARRALAAIGTAVFVGGGTAVIAAQPATAANGCDFGHLISVRDVSMCNYAWARANMTPLTPGGISKYGQEWCQVYLRFHNRQTATNALAKTIGTARANGIAYGADSWYC